VIFRVFGPRDRAHFHGRVNPAERRRRRRHPQCGLAPRGSATLTDAKRPICVGKYYSTPHRGQIRAESASGDEVTLSIQGWQAGSKRRPDSIGSAFLIWSECDDLGMAVPTRQWHTA